MAQKQTVTRETVEGKLFEAHGGQVTLGLDYTGVYTNCTFIDSEFGSWTAKPQHVLRGGSHPKRKGAKHKSTCMARYQVANHMHVPEIAHKAARSCRKSMTLPHWKTGRSLICTGSYEAAFVRWCGRTNIDFEWQIRHDMPCGHVYYVDARILDGPFADTWVEIKGFFRVNDRRKWAWFHERHPNSQLWDRARLRELGIL